MIAGFTSHITTWLVMFYDYPPRSVGLLNLVVVAPLGLILCVVLPFILMYFMSRDVHPLSMYKSIILSTFVGCWGGQVTAFFLNVYLTYFSGFSYVDPWLVPFWFAWQILVIALSPIFFVCLGGILFAYYQRTIKKMEVAQYVKT